MSPESRGGSYADPTMPSHAFLIAAFLPALAAVAQLALHGEVGTWALLIWLLGLAPVFLLTRYLGWKGALIGLGWTSAMVVMSELFAALVDGSSPHWSLVGAVVAVTASAALGAGLERQWWAARHDQEPQPEGTEPSPDDFPKAEVVHYFLEKLFEAARRNPPLSIVLFEVDRYEEYASMYGEAKARKSIEVAAQALKSETRASNIYGRVDDRRLAVFDNNGRGQPGRELVIDVRADVDFGLADGQALADRARFTTDGKPGNVIRRRVVAMAPSIALKNYADCGIKGRISG